MSENKMHLKRETQGAFCVLNANAKSQTRKAMKINVICTVPHMSMTNDPCPFHKYICNELGEVKVRITQGINRHNPLMI